MGNVLLRVLLSGLGESVIIALLIVVLERAREAARATATPLDDVIVAALLDGLRQVKTAQAD